jgi:hypothetical protein
MCFDMGVQVELVCLLQALDKVEDLKDTCTAGR